MKLIFPTVRLGDHCLKIGSGATPRGGKDSYQEDGIALIRSQNVYNNLFHYDGLAFIGSEQADKLSNVIVEPGDILLNITGDSVARVCQVPDDVLPARVNQHVAIIRPDPSVLDANFVRYYLVSPYMQATILMLSGAGATRKALTKGMIEDFQIPMPSIEEQKAIAAVLKAFDDKIELNRQMNHTLEAIARAIFKSWFVDFDPVHAKANGQQPVGMDAETADLFPDSFQETEIGRVPAGWTTPKLEDLADMKYGKFIAKKDLQDGPYPVYSGYSVVGFHNEYLYEEPQLVIVCRGVGGSGNVKISPKKSWITNLSIVITPKSESLNQNYLYWAMELTDRTGLITGSAQSQVTISHLASHKLTLAPEELIRKFQEITGSTIAKIETNKAENTTLDELRDALLPRLISGRLRLPAAKAIVEDHL